MTPERVVPDSDAQFNEQQYLFNCTNFCETFTVGPALERDPLGLRPLHLLCSPPEPCHIKSLPNTVVRTMKCTGCVFWPFILGDVFCVIVSLYHQLMDLFI